MGEVEPCQCSHDLDWHLPIPGRPCEMCPCSRYVRATQTVVAATAVPRTNTVENYRWLARRWWKNGVAPHGPQHDCLPCADLRAFRCLARPPLLICGYVIQTFRPITRQTRAGQPAGAR